MHNHKRQHTLMNRGARTNGETSEGPHTYTRSAPKVSVDQARLRPHLRQVKPTPTPFNPGQASEPMNTFGTYTAKTFAPNPQDLRGIPVVGRGVGGVSPGTDPLNATIRNSERRTA